ncbi:FAD binding domain-containing protein [Rhodoferax sp.]|uniref:FAD binding domain-containing protein n=1 Tax=Rhodoferax sp. TaxID=50421 RepID=UPI00277693AB|nr:xanthine dehydrogenase family protein subunit M [Rhodoferax sp.]
MSIEQYWAPQTLPEALEHLRAKDVTILAGGTDLMVQSHAGRTKLGSTLLNIRRIGELHTIEPDGEGVRIGALCTISDLQRDPLIKQHFDILLQACDHFASDQLRNSATLGGNVCNASPAGDTLVPLLVLDAQVELQSKPNGSVQTRRVPLAEFVTGPGKTLRSAHELVTALWLPIPKPGFVGRFYKFGTRPALDISAISIGIGGVRVGQTLTDVRLAYGAVAATPMRCKGAEAVLEGQTLDERTMQTVAATARDEVHPIDDVRASAWYRRELVHNMTLRMLQDESQT